MNIKKFNKQGQYYAPQPRQPYQHVHPVLIVGIALVIIHFILPALKMKSHPFVFGLGVLVILIGGILSVMDSV